MPLLKEWESFYLIVGSAAAALTGLQFVAAALIADIDVPATSGSIDAFATPTIVHFSGVLLMKRQEHESPRGYGVGLAARSSASGVHSPD